jgi:hypothetical protein
LRDLSNSVLRVRGLELKDRIFYVPKLIWDTIVDEVPILRKYFI